MSASLELETGRLLLRQLREADVEPLMGFYADEPRSRFVSGGGGATREETWRRVALLLGHWALRGHGFGAVEEKASEAFAGCVGLWRPEGWPELEVGWWLLREHEGRGYATEAARAARDHAYDALKARTLVSYIHPDNEPSKRVAARLGAALEGVIEFRGTPVEVHRHPPPLT